MEIRQGSPISVALQGIQKELGKISEKAASIAGSALEPNSPSITSLAEDLIGIKQSSLGVKANLQVINKLQKMEQEALDILA